MRGAGTLQENIRRIVFDVTSVLLPDHKDKSQAVVPADEAPAEEPPDNGVDESVGLLPRRLEVPSERIEPRSYEVYNEEGPSDLNDLDVFASRSKDVDGQRCCPGDWLHSRHMQMAKLCERYEDERKQRLEALGKRRALRNREQSDSTLDECSPDCALCAIDRATEDLSTIDTRCISVSSMNIKPNEEEDLEQVTLVEDEVTDACANNTCTTDAGKKNAGHTPTTFPKENSKGDASVKTSVDDTSVMLTTACSNPQDTRKNCKKNASVMQSNTGVRPDLALVEGAAENPLLVSTSDDSEFNREDTPLLGECIAGKKVNAWKHKSRRTSISGALEKFTESTFNGPSGRGITTPQNSAHALSYDVEELGPRGSKGKTRVRTRARRSLLYRSYFSRVMYSCLLCNLVVWIPAWLKLLTIERNETDDHHVPIPCHIAVCRALELDHRAGKTNLYLATLTFCLGLDFQCVGRPRPLGVDVRQAQRNLCSLRFGR